MEITVKKENGRFDLQDVYMFFRAAADGSYALKIRKLHKARTLNQNDYLWGVVYPALLDGLIDAGSPRRNRCTPFSRACSPPKR